MVSGLEYTGPKDLTQYFIRFSLISAPKIIWVGNYERRSCTQSQNFIRNTSMALGASSEVEVTVVLGRFVFVFVFSFQFVFVLLIS